MNGAKYGMSGAAAGLSPLIGVLIEENLPMGPQSRTIGELFDVERTPMKFDARITRRSAIAAAATLLLTGCGAGGPAGSAAGSAPSDPAAAVSWEAELAPEAPFMNVAGEEGSVMPGECWMQHEDGTVQVQVSGSSIPEPAVEGVEFADGILTVTMAQHEEGTPATMDFVLHQFVLSAGAAPEVAGVVLVRGDDGAELPAGELVELEEAE